MKKNIQLIIVLVILIISNTYAQSGQNNWLFGYNSGLTWSNTQNYTGQGIYGQPNINLQDIPTFISGSPIYTAEGCFSVSDKDGNLLFFSDGITIWNKNKMTMLNGTGLTGHASSVNSGVVTTRYPVSFSAPITKYNVFTIGLENANNLSYSVVDMTLDNGLGGVMPSFKNIPLTGHSGTLGENVAVIDNSVDRTGWVMAVGRGPVTYFNVWKTSPDLVKTARENVGSIALSTDVNSPTGSLKFSRDGKHFIWMSFNERFFIYGDFNLTNGAVTNIKKRDLQDLIDIDDLDVNTSTGYGVEFSPNNDYIYLSYSPGGDNETSAISKIHIFDANALYNSNNPNSINPVKTFQLGPDTANGTKDHFSGMQLGPDNRLYISNFNTNNLLIIPEPDSPLTTNVYKLDGILQTGKVMFGLPTFSVPAARVRVEFDVEAPCVDELVTGRLIIENGLGMDEIQDIAINVSGEDHFVIPNPSVGINNFSFQFREILKNNIYNNGPQGVFISVVRSNPTYISYFSGTFHVSNCIIPVNRHIRGYFYLGQ